MLINWSALIGVLEHPQFQQGLSVIFIFALLLGSILNEGKRNLTHWILSVLMCMIALEFIRSVYWTLHGAPEILAEGRAITLLGVSTYIGGLVTGWSISHAAARQARKKILRERSLFFEERTNHEDPIRKP